MKFNRNLFLKYKKLNNFEKLILKTCCYFPPKKRRLRGELKIDTDVCVKKLENAFGENFWNIIEGKKVLDFGCGEGEFVIAMATRVHCKAEGVDIQSQFDIAKKYIGKHKIQNTEFYLGSSNEIPAQNYDVVYSHDAFEHFEAPVAILDEMVRLLKPGGTLFIKFGPTWKSPYGRHMSGTYKKSRPWIHLLIPEKNMMRVHSVYHNDAILYEKYKDLKGGLNKMTIKKAKQLIENQPELSIVAMKIIPWRGFKTFIRMPFLKEFFGSGVCFLIIKN